MLNRRAREMGLGSVATCTLYEARERAAWYRKMAREGLDPIEHRNTEREKTVQANANRRTFEQCAHEYHDLHSSGWKNAKHADQWINTLRTYAFPVFGKKRCVEPDQRRYPGRDGADLEQQGGDGIASATAHPRCA
jgi:hypothetical protein